MERERAVVTGLLLLQLILWLGFAVHRSPRFPGSLPGTLLGISGAILMVVPSFAYVAAKRSPALRRRLGARLPLRRLLAWHIWGGILGSLLAILHTGHRFESTLGLVLTGAMLFVIFSGYVGRHFLARVSLDLREKQGLLERLTTAYNEMAGRLAAQPGLLGTLRESRARSPLQSRLLAWSRSVPDPEAYALAKGATELAGSIADLEYGIGTDELLRRRFRIWLLVHVLASVVFYGLLALHIWASVYFGLRWLV